MEARAELEPPRFDGGLDCVRDFHPDAVICDFCLPDIDGLEVLRHLRGMAEPVYFIALTAGCGGGEAERALRAEADLFLGKPVDLRRLRTRLATLGAAPGELTGTVNVLN